jgi:hypothetical protein
MARPERLELPTTWFEARYSIQLSYGRVPCFQGLMIQQFGLRNVSEYSFRIKPANVYPSRTNFQWEPQYQRWLPRFAPCEYDISHTRKALFKHSNTHLFQESPDRTFQVLCDFHGRGSSAANYRFRHQAAGRLNHQTRDLITVYLR